MSKNKQIIDHYNAHCARHYGKFPFVPVKAKGAEMWDADGKRYIDMLSCYSAVSQGHCNEHIYNAVLEQGKKVTLVSGALYNETMAKLLDRVCDMTGMECALLKNGGVEAVETAIKAIRRNGYETKGIAPNQAEIIVAQNNFHGRTSTVISFSSDDVARDGFGPYSPGFKAVPFNDISALEAAITQNTAGVLIEPIQGEAGVIVPDDDYLPKVRELCDKNNIIMCLDEIQTGLGRTGKMFCFEHFDVRPDMVIVGKALGGGYYPIAGIATSRTIMDTAFRPGSEGSTHGENPLAGAVGNAALDCLVQKDENGEDLVARSARLGEYLKAKVHELDSSLIKEVRGRGLLVGVEFHKPIAHDVALELVANGVFAKDTHDTTIRFAPPLMVPQELIDEAIATFGRVIDNF